MKRARRLASGLCLGILLTGLTAHGAPQQAAPLTNPCSGDSFQIDLAGLQDANLGQDPEERVEQLRDWLWPVLLARLEATAGLEGLLIGSATQPLIRDDALAHVLDHPVGSTRSGIARDGTVVVMVQVEEPAAMQEVLLEAIDQESLHLGAVPRRTLVYRYAIDERSGYTDLCRLGSFDARWVESQRQGFRRATVRKAHDLESFLDGGVDLLSAQCTKQGLEVTGRVRSRVRKAPITVEHVASLHQKPEIQYVPIAQLGASPAQLSKEEAAWLARVAFFVENVGERELRQAKAELNQDAWNMLVHVRAWQERHPLVSTEDLLLSWLAQREMGHNLGFSLDPEVRARDAVRDIDSLVGALGDPRKLAALLYAWGVEPARAAALVRFIEEAGRRATFLASSLSSLQSTLRQSSDHDALGILTEAAYMQGSPLHGVVGMTAKLLSEHTTYQCARYDGPLQGTLTGMTMFYTDLLMKLWDSDMFNSSPDGLIPGFESVITHDLSSAYCTTEEKQYPHTRAWLGLREEQYAREGAERVRFAAVTTRVFARGSALGAGYSEEVEANADVRRFYRWWNAHYARVADWEPQYELLNQIMKWSVVVQIAALSEHQSCLAFLDQVPVDRSQRFDQWVAKHRQLKWRGPVPLVKRDEPTECLPVFRSRWYESCGAEGYVSGGVSAASKATVAAKPMTRPRHAPELGRLDAMSPGQPTLAPEGRLRYDAVPRPDGKLTGVEIDQGKRTLSARVDTAQSQRGTRHSYGVGSKDGVRQVTGVKKSWRLDQRKLEGRDTLDARHSTFGVAHLQADDVTSRVVHPRVTPQATAQMRSIGEEAAKRLDDGKKSLSQVAPDLHGVTKAWQLDDGRVLVELADTAGGPSRFGLMSSGGGNRGPPPPPGSLIGRFGHGGTHGSKGTVEVTLLPDDAARQMRASASAGQLRPSQRPAVHAQLADALEEDDLVSAERAFDDFVRRGVDPASLNDDLADAYREAVRQGKNTGALAALRLRMSIKYGKPRARVPESNVLPADGTDFIVPSSHLKKYVELADLPPGQSPALRAGTPPPAFHARLIDESHTLADAPDTIRQGGIEYVRLSRSGQVAASFPRRTYVIHPCVGDDQEENSDIGVECQGRTTAKQTEEARRRALRTMACPLGVEQARELGVTDCR